MLIAGPAWAQPAADDGKPAKPKKTISLNIGGVARITDKQVIADSKVVVAAYTEAKRGGPGALAPHVAALQAVLDHAPASYPKVEEDNGHVLFRTDPGQADVEMMMVAIVMGARLGGSVQIERTLNVYPVASLLLGTWSLQAKDTSAAIAWFDRGLKMQPGSVMLLTEKGAALVAAGQYAQALEVFDSCDGNTDEISLPSQAERARIQRGRGYALGELGRLDEAATAYETALQVEPDNRLAQGELRYIRSLQAGQPKAVKQN